MKIEIDLKKTVDDSYSIIIDSLPQLQIDKKFAIITNETIANLHLDTLLKYLSKEPVVVIKLKDGEEYKTLDSVEYILDQLFEHRLDRKSMLIAFGGGVVGDITGFVASIYQRGIEFIQIPTTLLSMVDSSVGGKTGVNSSYGKNLIGAFYQPKKVYIDPSWLATLPAREFAAGVAEIVKMAVVLDRDFFDYLESADLSDPQTLISVIAKSVELKAKIVALDEKESGIRQVLNYGHTFAHVIEQETNYKTYLHGECVAFGMIMANRLALLLGYLSDSENSRIDNLLKKHNLKLDYKPKDIEKFYDGFFLDKKSFFGKITFILADGLGGFKIVDDVPKETVLKAIE